MFPQPTLNTSPPEGSQGHEVAVAGHSEEAPSNLSPSTHQPSVSKDASKEASVPVLTPSKEELVAEGSLPEGQSNADQHPFPDQALKPSPMTEKPSDGGSSAAPTPSDVS
jgi:hypothetical protein